MAKDQRNETNAVVQPNPAAYEFSSEDFAQELNRVNKTQRRARITRSTLGAIIVVAAIAVIISTFFITVLQIRGASMEPTLHEGELVVASHSHKFETGDVIAFYYNNTVLLKRVIGNPGDWVDISEDGVVSVNGQELEEDYVDELALGDADISFPYQVPENRYFVLGDHRSVSIDSRSDTIGTVADDQVIGKVLFRVWPIDRFGPLS